MIEPRQYQQDAEIALNNFIRYREDNPVIVLPTGAGKTPLMAMIIRNWLTSWSDTRICVLAHTKELVAQNALKLAQWWPEGSIGVYSAGLKKRDTQASVIFASIQSVYKRAVELGGFNVIFVDEAHRIPLSGEGQYRRFIEENQDLNRTLRVVGMTATPYRMSSGMVTRKDGILNDVCYEAKVSDLIEQGYLCNLISKAGSDAGKADISNVHIKRGDYDKLELEMAVNRVSVVKAACMEIVRKFHDRKAWLVFCAGVEHAEHVSEEIEKLGIEAPVIEGNTPSKRRDELIERYRNKDLRCLVNVNVLSEGFNAPHVDAIAMLRPTKSPGLYYQQVGRGLRFDSAKDNCLVLDFAGNIIEHGPIDKIEPKTKTQGNGTGIMNGKTCPDCKEIVYIAVRQCPSCGHEWPAAPVKHDMVPSHAEILSKRIEPEWYDVDEMHFSRHEKKDKPPSLRVDYMCGNFDMHSEWVCLEHEGYAKKKATRWWFDYTGDSSAPTVDQALEQQHRIKKPARILVDTNGRFSEIKKREFKDETELENISF